MSRSGAQALPSPLAGAWAGDLPSQIDQSRLNQHKTQTQMSQPFSSASSFLLPAALQGSVWASNTPSPPDVLDAALMAIQDAERAMQRAEAALQYIQSSTGSAPAADTNAGAGADLATVQDFEDSAAAAATARKALDLARTEVLKAAQVCKSSKDAAVEDTSAARGPLHEAARGQLSAPVRAALSEEPSILQNRVSEVSTSEEIKHIPVGAVALQPPEDGMSQPVHVLQQPLVAASAALAGSAAAVAAAAAASGHSAFLEEPATLTAQSPAPAEVELAAMAKVSCPAASTSSHMPTTATHPGEAASAADMASTQQAEMYPVAGSAEASRAQSHKGAVIDIMQPLSSAAAALAAGSAYLAAAIKPRTSAEGLPTNLVLQNDAVPVASVDPAPSTSPTDLVIPTLPPEVANPQPEDPDALAAALEAVKKLTSPKPVAAELLPDLPAALESTFVAPVDPDSRYAATELDVRSSHGSLRVPTLQVVDSMLFGPSETAGSTYSDAGSEPLVAPSLSSSVDRSLKLEGAPLAGPHTKSSDHATIPSPIGTSEAEANMPPTASATSEDTAGCLRSSAEGGEVLSSGHALSAVESKSQQNSGNPEDALVGRTTAGSGAASASQVEDSIITDAAAHGSMVDEASSKLTPVAPVSGVQLDKGSLDVQLTAAEPAVPAHADIIVNVAATQMVKSDIGPASKALDTQGSVSDESQVPVTAEVEKMLDTSVAEALGPVTPREHVPTAPSVGTALLETQQPLIINSGVVVSPTVTAADQLPFSPVGADRLGPEAQSFLPPELNTEEEGGFARVSKSAPPVSSFALSGDEATDVSALDSQPLRLASDLMSAKGSISSRACSSSDSQPGTSRRSFAQEVRLSGGSVTSSTPRAQATPEALPAVSESAAGKEIQVSLTAREEKPITIAEPVISALGESRDAAVAAGQVAAEATRKSREEDKKKLDASTPAVQLHHRQSSNDSHYMSADEVFAADQESSESTVAVRVIPETDEHTLPDDWPSRLNDADLGEAAERLVIRARRPMKMEAANLSLNQLHPDTVNSINAIILQRLSHRQALAVIKEGYPYITAFDTAWTIMDFLPGEERDRNADSWSNEKQPAVQKQLCMRMLDSVSSKKMPLLAEKLAKKVPAVHSVKHANVVLGVLSDEQLSQVVQGMFEAMSVERLQPWCTRAVKDLSAEASKDFTAWVKRLRSWQPPTITVVADSLNSDASLKASLDPFAAALRAPAASPRITSSPRMSTVQEEDNNDTSRLDQNVAVAKQAEQLAAAAAATANSAKHVKFAEVPIVLATPTGADKPAAADARQDTSITAQMARLDAEATVKDQAAGAAPGQERAENAAQGEASISEKRFSSSTLSDGSVGNDWFLFPHVAGSTGRATPAIASGAEPASRAIASTETTGSGTMIEITEANKAKKSKSAAKRKPRWFFCGCFADPDVDEGSSKQKRVFVGLGSEPMSHSQVASHLSQGTGTSTNFAASPKKGFSQDTGAIPPIPEPPGTPSDRPDAESKLVVDSPIHDLTNQVPTPHLPATASTTLAVSSASTPAGEKPKNAPVQSASLLIARSKPLLDHVQMAPVTASATLGGHSFTDYKTNRMLPSRLTGKLVEDSPRVSSASTERILAGVQPFSGRQGSYESVVWPSTAAMGLLQVQSSEEEDGSRCAYTEDDLPGSLRQPRKPSAVAVIGSDNFQPSPGQAPPEPELLTQQWDGTSKKWVWC